jgi:hypothetical protein
MEIDNLFVYLPENQVKIADERPFPLDQHPRRSISRKSTHPVCFIYNKLTFV